MPASHFNITPSELHNSGSTMENLGDQVAAGGDKLQDVGTRLTSHASGDKSGVGAVIVKTLGKGTDVAGKVFSEGGRVAGAAGKRLHANAKNHSDNEESVTSAFRGIHDDKSTAKTVKPGGSGGGGESSSAGKNGGKSPEPHSEPSPSGIKNANDHPNENNRPPEKLPDCGDPIDISTGRVVLTQDDVDLPGVLPLVFSRTHLSSYRVGRWFGTTWASTVDERVEVEPDGVHLATADGMLLSYPLPVTDGVVYPASGPRWPLSRTEDGGYRIVDPDERRARYFAPTGGKMLPITNVSDGQGHRIDFRYGADGSPAEIRHSAGHRIAVRTANGRVTALYLLPVDAREGDEGVRLAAYDYDTAGRLVAVVNSSDQPLRFAYDAVGRLERWDDRNGMWYSYAYDGDGRCVRARGADGYLDYDFAYDRDNLVTVATDSLGHEWRFQLDEALRVVGETDPAGNTTVSEWNHRGQLLVRTDRLGHTTRFEYDDESRLVRLTYPDGAQSLTEYDERGWPVLVVDPDGAVWRRTYTEDGALAQETDPTGGTVGYSYDEAGNLVAVTDALGNTVRHEVNANGRVVRTIEPSGARTDYAYDEFGRLAQVTDPTGEVTRLAWTVEGLPRAETHADGTVEQWHYDGEGNVRESVDPQGRVSRTEIAHFDLPVAEVGPDGSRLAYAYDTELRLTEVTNEQGLTWRMTYDPCGNLTEETDFDGRVTRYVRDAEGNVVQRTNAAGQTVLIGRDALGRMVRSEADGVVTTFAYDPVGRLLRATSPDADLRFGYDRAGRVTSETVNGRAVTFDHDAAGRRIARRTPTGAVSIWDYDADDLPVALHLGGRTVRFGYDAAGREVRRRMGAVLLTQDWHANDMLGAQTLVADAGQGRATTLGRRAYTYHRDGLLASVTGGAVESRRFDVDPAGRVTAVTRSGPSEHYDYDPAGNIVSAQWRPALLGSVDAATVGARTYAGTALTGAGAVGYEYDSCGRLTGRSVRRVSGELDVWRYTWDAEDQMVGVVTPDGQRWRYRYDPLGRRIAKQRLDADDTVVEQVDFAWDGENLVEQVYNGNRALVWEWQPDTHRAVGQTLRIAGQSGTDGWVDQQFHAIVADLVGAPAELVDPDGSVAWHLDLSLWGALLSPPGAAYTPLRFPGQYFDPETGLHYNYHRYYDPTTGRYLSSDPVGLERDTNPLAYVANPTMLSDPLGLGPCPDSTASGSKAPAGKKTTSSTSKIAKANASGGLKNKTRPGTHGFKKNEQKRLEKKYGPKVHGASGGGKTNKPKVYATHESEHSIGFEVLRDGDPDKRGGSPEAKEKENSAPAYQEMAAHHRIHPGTGTSGKESKDGDDDADDNVGASGWNSKTYRRDQHTALQEDGSMNNAVQLNQLGYAHQKGSGLQNQDGHTYDEHGSPIKPNDPNPGRTPMNSFQADANTPAGKQARDSYDQHVENMQGVPYNKKTQDPADPNNTVYTPAKAPDPTPQDKAEMYLARRAAETGNYPTRAEENEARAKFGLDPIADKDPDEMDVD